MGTRVARKLGLRAGAQFKKLVCPQQQKENLGFDTRRRLCGNRSELKKQLESVYPSKASIIEASSPKSIKALNQIIRWRERETGMLHQHDLRHVDVVLESLGLENGNTVQPPTVDDVKDENPVQLDPEQISKYRSHVARCLFFSQHRADMTFAVNELCQRMSDPSQHR